MASIRRPGDRIGWLSKARNGLSCPARKDAVLADALCPAGATLNFFIFSDKCHLTLACHSITRWLTAEKFAAALPEP